MKKVQPAREHTWQTTLAWCLRVIILLSGIYNLFFEDSVIGLLILISLAIITFPSFFTRRTINYIPLEIEILLFIMVIVQFVIGEARGFYVNVPYYDKFVHYYLPMNIGLIGFLIFYTLYASGRLDVTQGVMFFLVVTITLGIGAAWEIVEYANDKILLPRIENWHQFQGNAQQDQHTDTMSDLIYDTVGAVFGALLAIYYTNHMIKRKSSRFREMIKEMAQQRKNPRPNMTVQQLSAQFVKIRKAILLLLNPTTSPP